MDKEKIEPEAELVRADRGLEKPEAPVVREEDHETDETIEKAKIRAERTATFQDYVVRAPVACGADNSTAVKLY